MKVESILLSILFFLLLGTIAVIRYNTEAGKVRYNEITKEYSKKDYLVKFDIDEFIGPVRNGRYENIYSIKELEIYRDSTKLPLTEDLIEQLKHTFFYHCGKYYSAGSYISKYQVEYFKNDKITIKIDFPKGTTEFGPFRRKYTPYYKHFERLTSKLPKCDSK